MRVKVRFRVGLAHFEVKGWRNARIRVKVRVRVRVGSLRGRGSEEC